MKHVTAAEQRRALVEAFTTGVTRLVELAIHAEVERFLGASPPKAARPPRAPLPHPIS